MKTILFAIPLFCSTLVLAQPSVRRNLTFSTDFPKSVVAADLNGNGLIDIVSASELDDKLAWYENLGGSVFADQQIISLQVDSATSLFAVDLDADGDIDLLCASAGDNKIAWYENDGNAVFSAEQIITTQAVLAQTVFAKDMNGDGDLDVLSASLGDNKIAWYENLGAGNFGPQQVITTFAVGPKSVFAQDLDGDGDADVLSASMYDDKIAWYENLGAGVFGPQQVITTLADEAHFVHAVDLNGDGDADVISTSANDNEIAWYENLGGGAFGPQQVIDIQSAAANIAFNDLDGDGDIDLVAAGFVGKWYENLGGGTFSAGQVISSVPHFMSSIHTADLDNDGDQEVISVYPGTSSGYVATHNNIGGTQWEAARPLSGRTNTPAATFAADLDLDGDLDVVCASSSDTRLVWFENIGGGDFEALQVISTGTQFAKSVAVADLNGDGYPDIVVGSHNDTRLTWYQNYGNGTFSGEIILSTWTPLANTLQLLDFDGDGDIDILTVNFQDGLIVWFENYGGGIFSGEITIASMGLNGPRASYATDLDGDGDLDVLSASQNDNKIAWYENVGGTTFGPQQDITVLAGSAQAVYATDLDGDGDPDVLSASYADGKVAWYENLGSGNFGAQQIISSNVSGAFSVSAIDFDNDGDDDVVATAYNIDRVLYYENLGGGSFGPEQIVDSLADGAYKVHCADLDSDGDNDLIATHWLAGDVVWYENTITSSTHAHGTLYVDVNLNGEHDSLDIGINQHGVYSIPLSQFVTTDINGNYVMNFGDTTGATYQIQPQPIQYWSIVSDSLSYQMHIDSSFTTVDSLDFGFYPDTVITSLTTQLAAGTPRCSDTINYWITYANNGTTFASGIVEIQLHDSVSYVSASPAADSIIGQSIYWSYDSLSYFAQGQINIQVAMPDYLSEEDTLTSYVTTSVIDSLGNVTFTFVGTLNPILVCNANPNLKTATPAGIDSLGYIDANTSELEYTIAFQNTSNATVTNITIIDQLDPNLDWQSVIPLASSSPMQMSIDQNGEMTISLLNIMLPDSNANEPASHGFIRYKVNLLPGLAAGTRIYNTANVVFHSSHTVITNTKINTLYDCDASLLNFDNGVCENDTANFGASHLLSTSTFVWDLPGIFTQAGSNLNWVADTAGVFDVTLTTTNSLCSIDTVIQVTVFPEIVTQVIDTTSICTGDSLLLFGQYQTLPGLYHDTLQSINGCDSVVGKQVENYVPIPTQPIDTTVICPGDSLLLFGQYQSLPGLYYNTFQSINGCDSVVGKQVENYAVIPIQILDTTLICMGDSALIFGLYQTQSGVYYNTLQAINGCDSILGKQMDLMPLPIINLTTFPSDSVCLDAGLIAIPNALPAGGVFSGSGVVGGDFDPALAGVGTHQISYSYTDNNGCTGTDAMQILVRICSGSAELNPNGVFVYPNPIGDHFSVSFTEPLAGPYSVRIFDVLGKLVYSKQIISVGSLTIQANDWGPGSFVLTLIDDASGRIEYTTRLVVQ
jgi:hypothetical protein